MTIIRRRILQGVQVRNLARESLANYISNVSRVVCPFSLRCDHLGPKHIHKWHVFHATGG